MFDLGDVVPLNFSTTVNGSLVDATAVSLAVTLPDGTNDTAVPTPDHVGLGKYSVNYPTIQVGRHVVRWVATGPAAKSQTDIINVREAASLAIMSLAEARHHLRMAPTETIDDDDLRLFVDAATAVIERHVNKIVARRTITEYHQFEDYRRRAEALFVEARHFAVRVLTLNAVPVVSLTSVATTDGMLTWDLSTLDVDGPLGIVTDHSGRGFRGDIKAVFVAGPAQVPANYILAAQIVVRHLWETQRRQSFGRNSPSFGLEDQIMAPAGQGYALPPRAVELLGGRPPVFA